MTRIYDQTVVADCNCGGYVTLKSNGFATYFCCMNPLCPHFCHVFRCYGSPIDRDLQAEMQEDMNKIRESI